MAKKTKLPVQNEGGSAIDCLATRPEKVAIAALGGSVNDLFREKIGHETTLNRPLFDEIWAVNRGLRMMEHDKLFVMDDLQWIAETKPAYGEWLKKHKTPIITSTFYDEFPMSVEFPFHEVYETVKDDIFAVNTISYMVAFAMHIGVKELWLYGCDFFYPDGNKAEEGGQAVAYLLGMATGKGMILEEGMKHFVPNSSTLLYANKGRQVGPGLVQRPPYGYHRKAELEKIKAKKNAA